jgi:hypothetical protein
MKDATAKLYALLTPRELGVLAIKHLMAQDNLEVGRIKHACPRKTYTIQDADYSETIERFFRMAYAWGLLHWQARHEHMRAALSLTNTLYKGLEEPEDATQHEPADATEHEPEDAELMGLLRSSLDHAESCLLALDVALDEACAGHGFDVADVRKLVGAEIFTPLESSTAEPDSEVLSSTKAALLDILVATR